MGLYFLFCVVGSMNVGENGFVSLTIPLSIFFLGRYLNKFGIFRVLTLLDHLICPIDGV